MPWFQMLKRRVTVTVGLWVVGQTKQAAYLELEKQINQLIECQKIN